MKSTTVRDRCGACWGMCKERFPEACEQLTSGVRLSTDSTSFWISCDKNCHQNFSPWIFLCSRCQDAQGCVYPLDYIVLHALWWFWVLMFCPVDLIYDLSVDRSSDAWFIKDSFCSVLYLSILADMRLDICFGVLSSESACQVESEACEEEGPIGLAWV